MYWYPCWDHPGVVRSGIRRGIPKYLPDRSILLKANTSVNCIDTGCFCGIWDLGVSVSVLVHQYPCCKTELILWYYMENSESDNKGIGARFRISDTESSCTADFVFYPSNRSNKGYNSHTFLLDYSDLNLAMSGWSRCLSSAAPSSLL